MAVSQEERGVCGRAESQHLESYSVSPERLPEHLLGDCVSQVVKVRIQSGLRASHGLVYIPQEFSSHFKTIHGLLRSQSLSVPSVQVSGHAGVLGGDMNSPPRDLHGPHRPAFSSPHIDISWQVHQLTVDLAGTASARRSPPAFPCARRASRRRRPIQRPCP